MDTTDPRDPHSPRADPPPLTPLGLDYFAPHAPERTAARAGNFALAVVILSLAPFACGVINVAVAANSYSPTITGSHRGGATVFLAAAVGLCGLGLARLVTLRHWAGVLLAAVVLITQLALVACTGAALL